jgi:hypothetical protein
MNENHDLTDYPFNAEKNQYIARAKHSSENDCVYRWEMCRGCSYLFLQSSINPALEMAGKSTVKSE